MSKYAAVTLVISLCCLQVLGCGAGKTSSETPVATPDAGAPNTAAPTVEPYVRMTAFILARCPHAAEAVRVLLDVKRQMGDDLGLAITYLGLVDSDGNIDPSMGELEIETARLGACVARASAADETVADNDVAMPDWENAAWLDYLACVYSGDRRRSGPREWESCATQANIDVPMVKKCLESGHADLILGGMYAVTMASQIVASPTIVVENTLYLGEQSTKSYLQYLCHSVETTQSRPAVCDGVPAPPTIAATLISDKRCDDSRKCDVEGNIAVLERMIPGFELTRLDYSSEEGKKIYELIQKADKGAKALPLLVLDENFGKNEELRTLMEEYLVPFGNGHLFLLGGEWDPTAEICANTIDDNGDGMVDCEDPTCAEKLECREEIAKRLDFFMMSGCPFALKVLPSIDRLLSHFGRNRKAVDFHLQFIGDVRDGELLSMHGEEEVAENIRMMCAESLYGKKYKFMEYVLCRAEDPDSREWEKCVQKGMSAKKIRACSEKQGREMLKESFELAENLGVRGSPSWILNNRLPMEGRTLSGLHAAYCEKNEPPGCDKTPAPEPERTTETAPSQCH